MARFYLRFVRILSLIFEKGGKPKNGPGFFLSFLSIHFLIFEKGEKEKNGLDFLNICNCTFLNI